MYWLISELFTWDVYFTSSVDDGIDGISLWHMSLAHMSESMMLMWVLNIIKTYKLSFYKYCLLGEH